MKTFLAIYLRTDAAMSDWNALPEGERERRQQEGVARWRAWAERHAASIVDHGGPLGRTKAVSAAGIADVRNAMAAWVIVRADSHAHAAKMFEGHAHFTLLPGHSVEIMECLPMPAQG